MTLGILINGRKRQDRLVEALKEVAERRERQAEQKRTKDDEQNKNGTKCAGGLASSNGANPSDVTSPSFNTSGLPQSLRASLDEMLSTKVTRSQMGYPQGVEHAKQNIDNNQYVLASAREVALLRISGQISDADGPFLTRTAAIYFRNGNDYFVAFDDSRDERENILLSDAEFGAQDHEKLRVWPIKRGYPPVAIALSRAESTHRIVPVFATESYQARIGPGRSLDRVARAILGDDVARAYAAWIYQTRKQQTAITYVLNKDTLSDQPLNEDHVELRFVALGSQFIEYIDATRLLCYTGQVLGVAIKNQVKQNWS